MQIDGRCLCGAATWTADVDPRKVVACHCTDCQTQSGTTFRTIVPAEEGSFALTSGSLRIFTKTAESGRLRDLAFCEACGTPVYGGPGGGGPGFLSLRVGPILQRAALAPVAQVWCRSAMPWLDRLASLPRIETQPGANTARERS